MLTFKINRLKVSFLTCLTLASIVITPSPLKAQTPAQPTPENPSVTPTEDLSDPNNLRPLTQSDSILSLKGGQKLMSEAKTAIDAEQYDVAAEKLQKARQVFNQLSNFYLQLFDSFSGIDNRIAEGQRKKALETGQMRDEATYQLALVHRAQNQPELSVPLLIQVVKSQNPTTELGKKAYQQLFEIGFVEDSFPTSNSAQ
jgi:thioredoxin-like negative regulator of GroEL